MAPPDDGKQAPQPEAPQAPQHPPVQPIFYLAPEKSVKKYYGNEDSWTAEEYGEEVRRVWAAQPGLPTEKRLDVILGSIGPVVRSELRCMGRHGERSPDALLDIIETVFGEKRTTRQLQQALFCTEQRSAEQMRFYSHRACNLFRQLTRRQATLGEAVSDDTVLRDHFMSSLRDPILVKMLKREVQADNSLTFVAIRDSAINWADDEGPQATATVAAVAASPSTPQDQRLSRLEDLMEKLLLAQTTQASMPAARNQPPSGPRRRSDCVDAQGRSLCFHCRSPLHRIVDCPTKN